MTSSTDSPDYLQPGGLACALHAALRALARPHLPFATAMLSSCLPRLMPLGDGASPEAVRELLERGLERMQAQDPGLAALLRARFWQRLTVRELSLQRNQSTSGLYAYQVQAIELLARSLCTLEREEAERQDASLACCWRNLPAATYTRLFGVTAALARLQAWLGGAHGPLLISMEGVGGLGKTALAHAAVQAGLVAGCWADLAWISVVDQSLHLRRVGSYPAPLDPERILEQIAWQFRLSEVAVLAPAARREALQARLAEQPCLIVVDDLEPAHHPESLIPALLSLAGRSRFLLTTRQRLPDLPGGANLPLCELPGRASMALLRYEAALQGLPALRPTLLEEIHATVGGNPLALKLVLRQAAALPLERVLENLRTVQGAAASDLFHAIYRQSWGLLAPGAREALLAMTPFSIRGATYDELKNATRLPAAGLDAALRQLVVHFFLSFDPAPPGRYTVQRLTHTFLLSGIFADERAGTATADGETSGGVAAAER